MHTVKAVGTNYPENKAVDQVSDELKCSNYFPVRKTPRVQKAWLAVHTNYPTAWQKLSLPLRYVTLCV